MCKGHLEVQYSKCIYSKGHLEVQYFSQDQLHYVVHIGCHQLGRPRQKRNLHNEACITEQNRADTIYVGTEESRTEQRRYMSVQNDRGTEQNRTEQIIEKPRYVMLLLLTLSAKHRVRT